MFALAVFPSGCDAKKSGAGMGGVYWAFVVCGILVVGVVGFFLFQYWKRQRALAAAANEVQNVKMSSVQSYEKDKLDKFNAHFQRDLELAAKKKTLKVAPETQRAIDQARVGNRKEAFDLIDSGRVPVDDTDSFGRTLLMVGAEIGDSRLCDGLLRRGADINFRNKFNGATVLHFAYQCEHESLGLSLVARGADDTIRAIDGRTCYQLRDNDYDVEVGGGPEEMKMPPRRDMNSMEGKGQQRQAKKSKKGTRRGSNAGVDKMGDPRAQYDKMGDPIHPGAVGGPGGKYSY